MGIESGTQQHKQFEKMRDTHSTISRVMSRINGKSNIDDIQENKYE